MPIPSSGPGAMRPQTVPACTVADLATWLSVSVPPSGPPGPSGLPGPSHPSPGAPDVTVTGVTLDSRSVRPGDLYAAVPGAATHGARYWSQALAAGAVAVLTDPAGRMLLGLGPDTLPPDLPVLVVDQPRATLGALAAAVYGEPARRLLMLGVTGTNGKTTTSYLIDSVLRAGGRRTGLVGTVEVRAADLCWPSVRTTPDATELHALLAVMLERGADVCSMEVSSHALVQHRVDGVLFDLVGFTNLSQDHLDYHGTMQRYFEAKAGLFTPQRARRGVVCIDDDWGRRLAGTAGIPVTTLTMFPTGSDTRTTGAGRPVDWAVLDPRPDPTGTFFTLAGPGGLRLDTRAPLPGAFNVANAALALAMLIESGTDPRVAARALVDAGPVPGRMEIVPTAGQVPGQPVGVVDYAHTPDAVAAAVAALRPASHGPLVVVLGAGGDRDRDKRPRMGAAAARQADVVVVTDDNPRSEPPELIRAAVAAGARSVAESAGAGERAAEVLEVAGRRAAIAEAVSRAWTDGGPAGVVLLAGKGHEQGQDVAGRMTPFDDRSTLRAELEAAASSRAPAGGPVR